MMRAGSGPPPSGATVTAEQSSTTWAFVRTVPSLLTKKPVPEPPFAVGFCSGAGVAATDVEGAVGAGRAVSVFELGRGGSTNIAPVICDHSEPDISTAIRSPEISPLALRQESVN